MEDGERAIPWGKLPAQSSAHTQRGACLCLFFCCAESGMAGNKKDQRAARIV